MINDLTKGSPARVILLYSLPIILGNLFQQIYNTVDIIIVGRFVSYQALAGVGITSAIVFLVSGFVIGTTSGLGIRTAQFFGAGEMDNVRRSIGTSIIICAAVATILTVFSVTGVKPVLKLMGTSDDIFVYARNYLTIICAGVSTLTAYNLVACILRALGDSRTPLYFLIFSSALNIILDVVLVKTLGLGVEGAAFATIFSQLISSVLCFVFAFSRYKEIRLSRDDFRTSWKFIGEHLSIGMPMAFQFSITALGVIFLNSALNSFPAPYIAGFSAASKITSLASIVPVSFGVAIANYCGQNYGARKIDRMNKGVNATILMSAIVCVAMSLSLYFLDNQITSLFVDKGTVDGVADIYDASTRYLHISAMLLPFLFLIFIYRNALQGIGKTFWPLMGGVSELVLRAITSFILPQRFGYTGVILVDCLSWVIACVILVIAYYSLKRKF